jgi:signal transduction histidine kinase
VPSKAGKSRAGSWRYVAVVSVCFIAAFGLSLIAQELDNYAYDLLIGARSRPDWQPQSAVVGIDEETFREMGGPRARRPILAAALESLRDAGPKAVAIDVILADPGDPIEDARLEAALRKTPNLIMPCELLPNGTWEDPLPRFAPSDPRRVGHVAWLPDQDGVTRRIPLEQVTPHQQRWALSLVALSAARNQSIQTDTASSNVWIGDEMIPVQPGPAHSSEDGRPLLIRYLRDIPIISVLDISKNLDKIRGKAVFLGETAQSASRDRIVDPYGEHIPGVLAHAQAFETLAHGDFLIEARPYAVLLASLAIAAAAGLIFALLSGWQAYALDVALLAFAHYLPVFLFHHGIVFAYTAPVAAAWLCSIGAAAYQNLYVRRQLERTESERSRYQQAIHWAAHEMRTPLTAIQGSSEIMSRYKLPEAKGKELSDMINSESKRLARIIQTFLDVERLADGQMELKREPFEAADVVETCMQRVTPLAERKRIQMTLDSAVEGTLLGDRELMEYAFYNLLTNAVKYSPAQTHVRVFCDTQGSELRLLVQDQGIGMDSKELKSIFKKFYRTKRAEASGEVGTGIGLSIVEQIVTHHGGRIEVTSEPGKGSCFTIVMKAHVSVPGNAKTSDRRG